MKKTKLLLSSLVSFLLAFVMLFAVACKGGGSEGSPNVRPAPSVPEKDADDVGITPGDETENLSLLGISIGTPGTTKFKKGEAFSVGPLAILATYLDSSKEPDPLDPEANLSVKPLQASDYEIDSSDFNGNRVGVYTIYISYEYQGATCRVSYNVTVEPVVPAYGGIIVELTGQDTYTLTGGEIEIPSSIVTVYTVNSETGEKDAALSSGDYTVQLYLGSELCTGNKATKNGVYSLVVTYNNYQDFVSVYVVNAVTAIELTNGANTELFTQPQSPTDNMTAAWRFKVTYANGATKEVKKGDAGLTIALDTNVVGVDKTANVTYVEKDAKGNDHTVTCEVTYTITEKQASTESVSYKVSYDVDSDDDGTTFKWVTSWAAGKADEEGTVSINASALSTGKNEEKSTSDGSVTAKYSYEFKGPKDDNSGAKELTITVGAKATDVTIKVYVSHASANATRTALLKYNGEIKAQVTPDATDAAPAYLEVLQVTNADAGTYVLTTDANSNTMRVFLVEISYTIPGEGGTGGGSTYDSITYRSEAKTYNAGDILGQNDGIVVSIDENTEVATYTGEKSEKEIWDPVAQAKGTKLTNRLKFAGGIAAAATPEGSASGVKNAIKVVAEASCTVTFYVRSSNNGTARLFQAYTYADSTLTPVVADLSNNVDTDSENPGYVYALTFELQAGTYYFGSASGGVGIYGFDVSFS